MRDFHSSSRHSNKRLLPAEKEQNHLHFDKHEKERGMFVKLSCGFDVCAYVPRIDTFHLLKAPAPFINTHTNTRDERGRARDPECGVMEAGPERDR